MKSNSRDTRRWSRETATRRSSAAATVHRMMYQGLVNADGTGSSSTSRVTPPPIPPNTAMMRIPTRVNAR